MGSLIWCGRLDHFDVNDDRNISTYHSRRATNSKIHSVDLGSGEGPPCGDYRAGPWPGR